jgi:hypothetical protein
MPRAGEKGQYNGQFPKTLKIKQSGNPQIAGKRTGFPQSK